MYTVKDINEQILKYVAEDIRKIESRFKIYKITDIQANIKLYSLGNRGIFSSLTSTIK